MKTIEFRNPSHGKDVPHVRIEHEQFFADIIVDQQGKPPGYIVIVQREGSPVVAISQHASMEEAQKSARQRLQRLAAEAA